MIRHALDGWLTSRGEDEKPKGKHDGERGQQCAARTEGTESVLVSRSCGNKPPQTDVNQWKCSSRDKSEMKMRAGLCSIWGPRGRRLPILSPGKVLGLSMSQCWLQEYASN